MKNIRPMPRSKKIIRGYAVMPKNFCHVGVYYHYEHGKMITMIEAFQNRRLAILRKKEMLEDCPELPSSEFVIMPVEFTLK